MIRKHIISVIEDIENFIDSSLVHTEAENCTHSIADLLQQFFDKKYQNENGRTGLPPSFYANDANNNQSKFQQGVSLS